MSALIRSSTLRWVLLALAGLAIAVAVGIVASRVTSQRIGLASEPLRAGESLAPDPDDRGSGTDGGARGDDRGSEYGDATTTQSTTSSATTPTPTTTTATTTPSTSQTTSTEDVPEPSEGSGGNDD